jgi:hypothetical protein
MTVIPAKGKDDASGLFGIGKAPVLERDQDISRALSVAEILPF